MSHGQLMSREEPVMCQTCGEPLRVKYLLIYCRNRIMETRKSLEMSDNLFEAQSQITSTKTTHL